MIILSSTKAYPPNSSQQAATATQWKESKSIEGYNKIIQ